MSLLGDQRLSLKGALLLLAAALVILAPGLTGLPPVDRDESRYAVATTQMLATGDFVDIRFQEQPRYLQPAGVYWLQAFSAATFTDPGSREIWAFRLPSLTAALAAVLVTGVMTSLWFGPWTGLMAGLLLASCMSLGFEARIAKTDASLSAAVTIAQFAFMRVYTGAARSRWPVLIFWIALGVGGMLKGPIILLVVGLCALALALWDRSLKRLAPLQPLWGLPLALLIAAPWYVAIGLATDGDFFRVAIGDNLLHKVGTGQQSHGGPVGYHLMGFALTFWPGALLAALAIPFAWRERARPEIRFLICWIIPAWLVFEFVSTKLPHYVLPVFPAIAVLTAVAATSPQPEGRTPWLKVLFGLFLLLWLAVSLTVSLLAPAGFWIYEARLDPVAIALAVAALVAVGVMTWRVFAGRPDQAVLAGAVAAAVVSLNTYGLGLPRLEALWLSPQIAQAARTAVPACAQPQIISAPYHEPSLVFLNGPETTHLTGTPEAAAEALAQAQACGVAVIGAAQRDAFLRQAATLGLAPRATGLVAGQNYSDGEDLALALFVATPDGGPPAVAP
ncbi:glycosyltransferase family 39 protein [Phenylobacterium sp.]|uniref:ArnT family glycosyltransferase n=1 Tax=Phenylobacterium sp. TaxID=1871053 RepID=UPI000C985C20|nr:glycosyltransferase family 39 protein [Phenylobacterium sp.]MAK83513.1 glycosyl transferase [Phenylobacterium sp.]